MHMSGMFSIGICFAHVESTQASAADVKAVGLICFSGLKGMNILDELCGFY